jgi:hypothetical protein
MRGLSYTNKEFPWLGRQKLSVSQYDRRPGSRQTLTIRSTGHKSIPSPTGSVRRHDPDAGVCWLGARGLTSKQTSCIQQLQPVKFLSTYGFFFRLHHHKQSLRFYEITVNTCTFQSYATYLLIAFFPPPPMHTAGFCDGNSSELHSKDGQFESRPGYRLSRPGCAEMRFMWSAQGVTLRDQKICRNIRQE